jgi:hypothetical protein
VWFVVAVAVCLLLAVLVGLLTRKEPYQCPSGRGIAASVRRHNEAGALLVTLEAKGIATQLVEEPAKPLSRRLPGLLYALYRPLEPQGPWYVVVADDDLPEARRLLSAGQG